MEKDWLGRAFLGRETRTTTTGNPAVEAEFSLQRLAFHMLRAIDVDLLWLGVLGSASRISTHNNVIRYYFWAYVLFLALSWLTPSMFHNPSATHPVDPEMFPGIAHHFLVDGQVMSLLPEFHPYSSFTWNVMVRDKEELAAEAEVVRKITGQ